jgi:hypothetical protein
MPQKTKTQLAKLLLTNIPPVAQHTLWIIAILNTYRFLIIIAPLCLSPVYHAFASLLYAPLPGIMPSLTAVTFFIFWMDAIFCIQVGRVLFHDQGLAVTYFS